MLAAYDEIEIPHCSAPIRAEWDPCPERIAREILAHAIGYLQLGEEEHRGKRGPGPSSVPRRINWTATDGKQSFYRGTTLLGRFTIDSAAHMFLSAVELVGG